MVEPERTRIRVILADDHHMFVEAIRMLLSEDPGIEVLEVVDNGEALLQRVKHLVPDVALVDVTMPGPGAKGIAAKLSKAASPTRLIALTMHLDRGFAEVLLNAGYAGYVVKDAAVAELLKAIRLVCSDKTYLSESVQRIEQQAVDSAAVLTAREMECLRLAADGLSNKRIARHLKITERTAKFHFENILSKLNASSRGEAVAIARRASIL